MLGALCGGVRTKRIPLRKEFALNTSGRRPRVLFHPPYLTGGYKNTKNNRKATYKHCYTKEISTY